MNTKKILLIGPLSPPITGNSLANDIVIKGLTNNKSVEIDYINTQFEVFKNDLGKITINKIFFFLKKFLKLYKIFGKDIIYITPGQTFYGVIKYAPFIYLAKLLNKQVIIHIHGNYLRKQYDLLSGIKKKIFLKTLAKVDKGIVLSKSLRDNLTLFLPSNHIYVVPNFVEDYLRPSKFKTKKSEFLKIIFLSNLMNEKGVLDVLKALISLKKKNIKFNAKFAGNIEENLKYILTTFFNTEEISYLGTVTGQQKKELLEWSNVFILPTYYKMEGVPISILEAMANGNIIITTKHAGIPDIISDRNGFFVKSKLPEEIVEKLIYIESNLENLGKIRLNNINDSKKYTEKRFVDSLLKIFTN